MDAEHTPPEPPKEHHMWCNFQTMPVEGCAQCAKLWPAYPYTDATDPEALLFKHFPDILTRKGT